jgi:hypothetical protein
VALNFYITNILAIGINGNWYQGLNANSAFNLQTSRAARIGEPINEYQWNANANVTYVPAYGKFAGFGDFIFHYDFFIWQAPARSRRAPSRSSIPTTAPSPSSPR